MGQISGIQKIARKKRPTTLFSRKQERRFVRGRTGTSAYREEERSSRVRIWQITFLWILFFLVLGYQLFFSGMLTVERVAVEGTGMLTPVEVERTVRTVLLENRWTIFPQDNFLLLSVRRIEELLLASSPLIRQVTVKRRFPDTLEVSLLERGDFLFWCSEEEKCFLIDEKGILQDWPEAREERRVSHLFLIDESRKPVATGDRILEQNTLSFAKGLPQAFLEQAGIVIQEEIFFPSRYADELRLETDKGFSLRISTDIPIERTLNTLRIVREKAVPEDRRADLVSVDLRIPGKAFYQLRDESEQEASVSDVNDNNVSPLIEKTP
ncbi:MAG: FtsQ-type POTRA domain-containing protein [Candidatus Moranbacteria bacterium]|nr:FtsQ-type POTRA domain-containing protein [Candidatus Moranbacteria bacterium]